MSDNDTIQLTRDVDATLIPTAVPITLIEGTEVTITQQLGGSFTVFVNGNLARIAGKDADALGKEPIESLTSGHSNKEAQGPVDMDQVWEQLRTCYDPEIPVNIVDLGLIYECTVTEKLEEKSNRLDVKMTLTAPGCGMGPILMDEVQHKLLNVPNVTDVNVELVFDPPWDRSRMSESAKLELGMYY